MLFITHILLEVYAFWQGLGALRIMLGLCAMLLIIFPSAVVDIYRWFRDRDKRAKAQARLEKFDRELRELMQQIEEEEPEIDDFDENGVPYGPPLPPARGGGVRQKRLRIVR